MLRRRRPLVRAAAVGGIAHAAGKAGANKAAAEAEQAAASAPEAAPVTPPSADDRMAELTKLKGLLDAGVLTQDEFDAQKQKILQTM